MLFIDAIFMYSGWSELVDGEMQETDRDRNLVCSDLELGDFLFSLLEFLDLDCWDRFRLRAVCRWSPSSEQMGTIRCCVTTGEVRGQPHAEQ